MTDVNQSQQLTVNTLTSQLTEQTSLGSISLYCTIIRVKGDHLGAL